MNLTEQWRMLTACGWLPPRTGVLVGRQAAAAMEAMPCRKCLRGAR